MGEVEIESGEGKKKGRALKILRSFLVSSLSFSATQNPSSLPLEFPSPSFSSWTPVTAPNGEKSEESSGSVASWGSCFFCVCERGGTVGEKK